MHFSAIENILWAAITLSEVALVSVILFRGIWRRFPLFASYAAYTLTRESVMLFFLKQSEVSFFYAYYLTSLIGSGIMLAVLAELVFTSLRPIAKVPRVSLKVGLVFAIVVSVSVIIWCLKLDMVPARRMAAIAMRMDLMLTCLRFALFAFIAAFSRFIGLHWRHHVFAIAAGLGLYSCVDLVTTAAGIEYGVLAPYAVHQIGKLAYFLAVLSWCWMLAAKEPEPVEVSPAVVLSLSRFKTRIKTVNKFI
jgi:hypothetical protein